MITQLGVELQALKAAMTDADHTDIDRKIRNLNEYIAGAEAQGVLEVLLHVLHIRITKMYKREYKRLEVAIRQGTPADHIWGQQLFPLLRGAAHKGHVLVGMAPMADLERIVQGHVTDMTNAEM